MLNQWDPGLEDLLKQFFYNPSIHMKTFQEAGLDQYDPAKEQLATERMRVGQQKAQSEVQGSMWKQFETGRQNPAGFGGVGRARKASMTGTLKDLETGREQAQLGLEEDIAGFQEDHMTDIYNLIGNIQAGGAKEATEFSLSDTQEECDSINGTWMQNMDTGQYFCSGSYPG